MEAWWTVRLTSGGPDEGPLTSEGICSTYWQIQLCRVGSGCSIWIWKDPAFFHILIESS